MKHFSTAILMRTVLRYRADSNAAAVAPTDEQLRDDGSVDGVPLVTAEQRAASERRRLDDLTALTAGYKPKHGGWAGPAPKPCTVTRLSDGRVFRFPGVRDACETLGLKQASLYGALKLGDCWRGYRWQIVDREGTHARDYRKI